ncbi:recombinase family protein [Nostocoides veronense]|uniref:Resolvase/invertase-type recombinase catalytic domain-containing protein n=1 Tax=Nostocoides veronense TaxID=330836 RepID=A0ABN2M1X7_9MICO
MVGRRQEQVLADLWRAKGRAYSCAQGEDANLHEDPDDPSRRLIRQVLGAVSEYERAMVRLRLRNGRRRKAERGGYAYGSPPLGKRTEGAALVDDPEEAATVARIHALHGQRMSLRQIADTLTAEGRPTKRGGRWRPLTVSRVVQRN